jgi:hypothetical protein
MTGGRRGGDNRSAPGVEGARCLDARSERGTVSAFVVALSFACLLAAGLALDGGRIVAARIEVADVAGNAARAGAQHLVGLRAGQPVIDPGPARAAAEQVLAASGASGTVSVSARSITVTARTTRSLSLLALVGVGSRTVEATATARMEEGA